MNRMHARARSERPRWAVAATLAAAVGAAGVFTAAAGGTLDAHADPATLRVESTVLSPVRDVQDLQPGDVLQLAYTVTNTSTSQVTDIALTSGGDLTVTCPATALAAGESMTCETSKLLIKASMQAVSSSLGLQGAVAGCDPDTGGADCAAVGHGDVRAFPVAFVDPDPAGSAGSSPAPVSVTAHYSWDDADGDDKAKVGDEVRISYEIAMVRAQRDLHALTFSSSLAAADGAAVSCPATIATGASITCTRGAHTVTEAEAAAGHITDNFSASALDDLDYTWSSGNLTDVITTVAPYSFGVLVEPVDIPAGATVTPGDLLTVQYRVTNKGSEQVTGIVLTDKSAWHLAFECPKDVLATEESMVCAAQPHKVMVGDGVSVSMSAQAVGSAIDPNDSAVVGVRHTSMPWTLDIVAVGPGPWPDGNYPLSVVPRYKWADRENDGVAEEGDRITITYTVRNTTAIALRGLTLSSSLATTDGAAVTCADTDLAAGAETTCTRVERTITAADIKAGRELADSITACALDDIGWEFPGLATGTIALAPAVRGEPSGTPSGTTQATGSPSASATAAGASASSSPTDAGADASQPTLDPAATASATTPTASGTTSALPLTGAVAVPAVLLALLALTGGVAMTRMSRNRAARDQ